MQHRFLASRVSHLIRSAIRLILNKNSHRNPCQTPWPRRITLSNVSPSCMPTSVQQTAIRAKASTHASPSFNVQSWSCIRSAVDHSTHGPPRLPPINEQPRPMLLKSRPITSHAHSLIPSNHQASRPGNCSWQLRQTSERTSVARILQTGVSSHWCQASIVADLSHRCTSKGGAINGLESRLDDIQQLRARFDFVEGLFNQGLVQDSAVVISGLGV
ncbi:hypothetical protein BCR44DRAFT_1175414 [Catenaria anguillulae PL171]|uniref:Uncharacterized protein n=1 Tax=Catenaria anguillulae PL171 TaxID=765915 RepID=A0A1Y2I0V1_9FUNG|nr:hypothetical protein BCR44DRAFT_1175414 [Catenaria anguillulae PL171]